MTRLRRSMQAGFTLIESLIGLLIFSIGVLALVAMYGNAVGTVTDSQFRIEAANHANDVMNQIWASTPRMAGGGLDPVAGVAALNSFAHSAAGTACGAFGGAPSANAAVTAWLGRLQDAAQGLPKAGDAGNQQILIEPGSYNRVTITICWWSPRQNEFHNYQLVTYVN